MSKHWVYNPTTGKFDLRTVPSSQSVDIDNQEDIEKFDLMIDEAFKAWAPKCECGAAKVYGESTSAHSEWCPVLR